MRAPTLTLPRKRGREILRRGRAIEPVGTFPTRFLAELRAQRLQPFIRGGDPQWAASLSLLVGVMNVVVGRVDLDRPSQRVVTTAVLTAETPQIHLPEVE